MSDLLVSMRPRQWTKNLLLFAGLIFAAKFTDLASVVAAFAAFTAFCLGSSAGYLVNDVVDREADAKHPEKRDRPIASGRFSAGHALISALALAAAGLVLITLFHPIGYLWLAVYFVNQAFYIFVARRAAILDVFIIAFGFVIRAVAGAAVLDVRISPWLLFCTLMLALFLGFAKRKHELELGTGSRESLGGYSPQLVDHLMVICAAATVLSYGVYAIESRTAWQHPLLGLTIPFPLFGFFRYLQLVYVKNRGGDPDRALLRDPWLAGTVLLWILVSLYAMSGEERALYFFD